METEEGLKCYLEEKACTKVWNRNAFVSQNAGLVPEILKKQSEWIFCVLMQYIFVFLHLCHVWIRHLSCKARLIVSHPPCAENFTFEMVTIKTIQRFVSW